MSAPPGVYQATGYGENYADAKFQALNKLALEKETYVYHRVDIQQKLQTNSESVETITTETELSSNALFNDPVLQYYTCSKNEIMVVATVDSRSLLQRLEQTEVIFGSLSSWFKNSDWRLNSIDHSFTLSDQTRAVRLRDDDLFTLLEAPSNTIRINSKSVWYGKRSDSYRIDIKTKSKMNSLIKLGENGQFDVLFADSKRATHKYSGKGVYRHFEKGKSVLFLLVEHEQPIEHLLPGGGDNLTLSQQHIALSRFVEQWQRSSWKIGTARFYTAN
ncbi:hypothetical protein AB4341_05760 [Vibrio breoganii]